MLITADYVVVTMGSHFMAAGEDFPDQMGKAFSNPAENKEGCFYLGSEFWVLG